MSPRERKLSAPTKGQGVSTIYQASLALTDNLVATANLALLVLLVKLDPQVLQDQAAKAADHPDLLARKVMLVDVVSLVQMENAVLPASLVFKVKLVHLENKDSSVPLVLPEFLASPDGKEKMAVLAHKVSVDNKATRDILANLANLDSPERPDPKVHKVHKVSKVLWALLVPWAPLELMALMASLVLPARLDPMATTGNLEPTVNPVLLVKLAQKVTKAKLVHPVRLELLA